MNKHAEKCKSIHKRPFLTNFVKKNLIFIHKKMKTIENLARKSDVTEIRSLKLNQFGPFF